MDIKIESLTKTYGYQKAVDDISFEVKTGEVLGFLGPNGAGKTTTMKMITGYLDIEEGDVNIGGQSVKGGHMKKHIGYLPENNPLYVEMPLIDFLVKLFKETTRQLIPFEEFLSCFHLPTYSHIYIAKTDT